MTQENPGSGGSRGGGRGFRGHLADLGNIGPRASHARQRWQMHEITISEPDAMRRSITGTAIGNFMEWYDFGVYGFLAATIAQVFYPGGSATSASLIATFGTLAASFAVRPIGGFVFGPLGDRIGRKRVLTITILLMAIGTTVTGVLPGYATIGVWAPILLLVTRILQGFSTGGEYVGAMTYVDEHASDRRRGFMGGFLPLGTLAGYVLGSALVTGLSSGTANDFMLTWGWRIPFLLGAPLGLVGLYMRLKLEESPAYEKLQTDQKVGEAGGLAQLKSTVLKQWKPILVCMGLVLTFNVTNYMLTGYIPTYFSKVLNVPKTPALVVVVAVLLLLLIVVVFVAKLSDRIGRKPIMWTGCGLLVIGGYPAFLLMRSGMGIVVAAFGVLLIGLMLLCFNSTEPSTLPTLFPTNVRYGSVAVAFNISVSAFGGTTPLIAEALVAGTGNPMVPAYILIIAGLIGVVSVAFTPEPAGKRLPGSGPAVETEEEAQEMARTEWRDEDYPETA